MPMSCPDEFNAAPPEFPPEVTASLLIQAVPSISSSKRKPLTTPEV
jgi:hypothetical protein